MVYLDLEDVDALQRNLRAVLAGKRVWRSRPERAVFIPMPHFDVERGAGANARTASQPVTFAACESAGCCAATTMELKANTRARTIKLRIEVSPESGWTQI